MPKSWRKNLIARCKASIMEILREVEAADDLDLWEELDGKAHDVLLTYRKSQQQPAEPTTFRFSDGVTRDLSQMAFAHAVADQFPDLDEDHECAAFLMRGERST